MSSKPPRVPKYRLHKGSGQAFVQIQGSRQYLGKFNSPKSLERYGRIIAELAVKPAAAAAPRSGSELLVVQLAALYWEFASGYYVKDGRPTGHIYTVKRALHVLRTLYGNVPVVEFGPLSLRTVQQRLVDEGRCRKYVNQVIDTVKRIFRWAVSRELAPVSIYQALVTVPGLKKGRTAVRETAPVLPVADLVVEGTLPYLPPVVVDMVRFQQLTGCRPGELCGVRPCDVDRSGDVWAYRPAGHKTEHLGRDRVVWIGPQAQAVLLPYLLRDSEAYCFSPAESDAERRAEMRAHRKTPVQPSQRDRRTPRPKRKPKDHYTKDSYARAVRRAVEKANRERTEEAVKAGTEPDLLAYWHPNQLRHSLATKVRREFNLEAAQTVLGHAKADVTQVYAERDMHLAAEVMRRIG